MNIKFNDINSDDYNLVLVSCKNELPELKKYTVNVPGMQGELDLSEEIVGRTYENKELELVFIRKGNVKENLKTCQLLIDKLHGGKFKIYIGETTKYYLGRIHIEAEYLDYYAEITITADCSPFLYENEQMLIGSF